MRSFLLLAVLTIAVPVFSQRNAAFNSSDWPLKELGGGAAHAVYENGRYLISQNPWLLISTNGSTWATNETESLSGARLSSANGMFFLTSGRNVTLESPGTPPEIRYSTNGVDWAQATIANLDGVGRPIPIVYGGGKFMAVAQSGLVMLSEDGNAWTNLGIRTFGVLPLNLAYGNGIFTVTDGGVITSTNFGNSWSAPVFFEPTAGVSQIVFGNGVFVGVSGLRGQAISRDGIHWNLLSLSQDIQTLAFGNGRFFASTKGTSTSRGYLMTSIDGEHWQRLSTELESGPISQELVAAPGQLLLIRYNTSSFDYSVSSSPNFSAAQIFKARGQTSLRAYGFPGTSQLLDISGGNPFPEWNNVNAITIPASGFLDIAVATDQPARFYRVHTEQ